ncbi:hypothetical protein [Geodermatophilus obscurus]|uniref:Uncharacterized protein n=1 Tax=Geodermatophilus obscurus (strain ATCC 25078 / DSM 43160 / JCM 3152 / CCUG 61914 / KCC A-0152 / KCTC 9177 / NBRC 13315 / NRRL B-3577 / G-20) TaxID=526225 RepID=D2SEC4_GEOOG|nr:hypothetical protein [Geodermatophilus obscurus]ADB74596.1 hypothetical protein Gobs_1893 [Geodermatophilus obscurus DSM 43160]
MSRQVSDKRRRPASARYAEGVVLDLEQREAARVPSYDDTVPG